MFSIILLFLMLCAFLSGWLYMAAKIVKEPNIDKNILITESFFSGVGEYFLSMMGMVFIVLILSICFYIGTVVLGKHLIGSVGVTNAQVSSAMISTEAMKNFVLSLTSEQIVKINLWIALMSVSTLFYHFITMFYVPAMYFKKKNPFVAFLISLKDLFSRKFLQNCVLFIYATCGYFLLYFLAVLFDINKFTHFIFTLLFFYFISFVVVLIFNFYYANYAKVGSCIDKTV